VAGRIIYYNFRLPELMFYRKPHFAVRYYDINKSIKTSHYRYLLRIRPKTPALTKETPREPNIQLYPNAILINSCGLWIMVGLDITPRNTTATATEAHLTGLYRRGVMSCLVLFV